MTAMPHLANIAYTHRDQNASRTHEDRSSVEDPNCKMEAEIRPMKDEKARAGRLRKLLGEVFMNVNSELADSDRLSQEFVFHMTDWEDDLRQLAKLYSHPEEFSAKEAEKIVAGLLYHASDHILHAARLYDYVPPAARSASADEGKLPPQG